MKLSSLMAAIALLFGSAWFSIAFSQSYPSKPIRLVVPFPPGGVHDTVSRILQPRFSEGLGQQILIENRPGAGGNIAADAVAKSPPDGYTVLVATDSVGVGPHLYRDTSLRTFKDFAAITKLASYPMALVCSPGFPSSTVGELVARAKAMPGKITGASPGSGTSNHLVTELFKSTADIDLLHIPFKGAGPAMTEVMAGRVDCIFITPAVWMPQVRSGKVKVLAVAATARISLAPDIPTFAESGYPGFQAEVFTGLAAPAATPASIVERLYRESVRTLRLPEIQVRLAELGATATASTPAEFSESLRRDYERWGKVIRDSGIKGD